MSAWKTDSQGTDASSPPSSSLTRWTWGAPAAGRSPDRPRAGHLRLHPGQLGASGRIDRGEQQELTSDEQTRMGELERDNARLRMERDLLKRTAACWVKEQSSRVALLLCRCLEGRRILGRRLHRGRGDALGLLCLDYQRRSGTVTPPAGGDQAGRRDPPHPRPIPRRLRLVAGHRRAAPARLARQPYAGRAADARPWHRRASAPSAPQPD